MALYRSHSSVTYSSRTNTTVTKPAGTVDGDKLIMVFSIGRPEAPTPAQTPPAGWTLAAGFPATSGVFAAFHVTTWCYTKTANSEGSDYTFTHAAFSSYALCIAVSGAASGVPQITHNSGTGTTTTALGLTTTSNDALIIFAAHNWDTYGTASPPTGSTPTFTERLDSATSLWYFATGVLATPGATGNKTHNNLNTNTDYAWRALLIGVESAAAPTIDTHPSNVTVTEPATANFTVAATTSGGALSYQWQVDTGGGFGSVSTGTGGTTASYTTAATVFADSGDLYRCVVTDSNGSTNSNAATLTVEAAVVPQSMTLIWQLG